MPRIGGARAPMARQRRRPRPAGDTLARGRCAPSIHRGRSGPHGAPRNQHVHRRRPPPAHRRGRGRGAGPLGARERRPKGARKRPGIGKATVRKVQGDDPSWWVLDADFAALSLGVPLGLRPRAEASRAARRWRQARAVTAELDIGLGAAYAGVGEEADVPVPAHVAADAERALAYAPQAWFFPANGPAWPHVGPLVEAGAALPPSATGLWVVASDPLTGRDDRTAQHRVASVLVRLAKGA